MNERIKAVRAALGLSQQEFAEKIGIKRGAVANYEVGRNEPIDAVVSLICKTYNVNENWLRTGDGEMFIQISRDQEIMDFVADTMQDDEDNFRRRFLLALARLPSERWADIEAFAKQITAENKEADQD